MLKLVGMLFVACVAASSVDKRAGVESAALNAQSTQPDVPLRKLGESETWGFGGVKTTGSFSLVVPRFEMDTKLGESTSDNPNLCDEGEGIVDPDKQIPGWGQGRTCGGDASSTWWHSRGWNNGGRRHLRNSCCGEVIVEPENSNLCDEGEAMVEPDKQIPGWDQGRTCGGEASSNWWKSKPWDDGGRKHLRSSCCFDANVKPWEPTTWFDFWNPMPPPGVEVVKTDSDCYLKPYHAPDTTDWLRNTKRITQCGFYWNQEGLSKDCASIDLWRCQGNNHWLTQDGETNGVQNRRTYGYGCQDFKDMVPFLQHINMDDINKVDKSNRKASKPLGTVCLLEFPNPNLIYMKQLYPDAAPRCTVRSVQVKISVQKVTVCENLDLIEDKSRLPEDLREADMDCKSERRASFDGIEGIEAFVAWYSDDYKDDTSLQDKRSEWAFCHGDASSAIKGKRLCPAEYTQLWNDACKEVSDSMKAFKPHAEDNDPKFHDFWQNVGIEALKTAAISV